MAWRTQGIRHQKKVIKSGKQLLLATAEEFMRSLTPSKKWGMELNATNQLCMNPNGEDFILDTWCT